MENSEPNSLFSAFHWRKIALSRPWFPSIGMQNSIDYAKCPSPGTENSERNSLFSVLHGRKIAFSRPWFPSLGTENSIEYAKYTSPRTENSQRKYLFSVLRGRKIAFSRPWFPSLGTENNTIHRSQWLTNTNHICWCLTKEHSRGPSLLGTFTPEILYICRDCHSHKLQTNIRVQQTAACDHWWNEELKNSDGFG